MVNHLMCIAGGLEETGHLLYMRTCLLTFLLTFFPIQYFFFGFYLSANQKKGAKVLQILFETFLIFIYTSQELSHFGYLNGISLSSAWLEKSCLCMPNFLHQTRKLFLLDLNELFVKLDTVSERPSGLLE